MNLWDTGVIWDKFQFPSMITTEANIATNGGAETAQKGKNCDQKLMKSYLAMNDYPNP